MHIHIANIGEHPEPVKNGIRGIGCIDSIFLLYSKKYEDKAKEAQNSFIDQGYQCSITPVTGFNFQEIVDTIYRIYDKTNEKGVEYSINITGGTNLMAAAACSTAFFTGAKLYYVLYNPNDPDQPISERIIEVPTPKIPDVRRLKDHEKSILKLLNGCICDNNSGIADTLKMSKQLCGRYIHHLEELDLVESFINDGDRRYREVKLTREGKMIAGWF